jgi:hypothetical protein
MLRMAVAQVKLSRHMQGGTEENDKILSQDSQSSNQDFNSAPSKYKSKLL